MKKIIYPIIFNKIKGLGKKTLLKYKNEILNLVSNEEAYLLLQQICQQNKRAKIISEAEFNSLFNQIKNILNKQEELNIKTITIDNELYPNNFKRLEDAPLYFFYKGNIEALHQKSIAIIGTRNANDNIKNYGIHLSLQVAQKGWNIVSGLAEGCDTAAHIGALQANGLTTAIVATPLDKIFPASNKNLEQEILQNNGCIISEYLLGSKTTQYDFIARDRLQCGLADGLMVIAVGEKGGSYNAINGAIKLGIPIGCVKYPEQYYKENLHTIGNQRMLRNNKVTALDSIEAIDNFLSLCTKQEHKEIIQNSLF